MHTLLRVGFCCVLAPVSHGHHQTKYATQPATWSAFQHGAKYLAAAWLAPPAGVLLVQREAHGMSMRASDILCTCAG
jgi:hypothetical protein